MITYWKRILRNSWLNITRYPVASFASVIIVTFMSFAVLGSVLGWDAANYFIASAQMKLDFSIYFQSNATSDMIQSLQQKIEQLPYVSTVRLITKEEAYNQFKEMNQTDPAVTQALKEVGYNPLADYLIVKTKDAQDYQKLYDYLQSTKESAYIETNSFAQNKDVIDKLVRISGAAKAVLLGGVLFLFLAAIAIVATTTNLVAHSQRKEIEIMKLIGASPAYLRLPYFLAALFYAAAGTALAAVLFFALAFFVGGDMARIFAGLDLTSYLLQNVAKLLGVSLLLSVASSVASVLFSINKYLEI